MQGVISPCPYLIGAIGIAASHSFKEEENISWLLFYLLLVANTKIFFMQFGIFSIGFFFSLLVAYTKLCTFVMFFYCLPVHFWTVNEGRPLQAVHYCHCVLFCFILRMCRLSGVPPHVNFYCAPLVEWYYGKYMLFNSKKKFNSKTRTSVSGCS